MEFVIVQWPIIVHGKENSVTRERENGERMKEIGKAPYKLWGSSTIVEGCRDKARRESKGGFQDQYHAFIHLPLISSTSDLYPFLMLVGNTTRQEEREAEREKERGREASTIPFRPTSSSSAFTSVGFRV